MCNLFKAFNFVSSCANKSDDTRASLKMTVYDRDNSCIVATDGRRAAVMFTRPENVAGLDGLPDDCGRFLSASFNRDAEKITVTRIDSINYPNYLQIIPGGIDLYKPELIAGGGPDYEEINLSEHKMFGGMWEHEPASQDYYKNDLPAGLCVTLDRIGSPLNPEFLHLPTFSKKTFSTTNNEWQILNGGCESPTVLVNENFTNPNGFRIVYIVMPFRDSHNDVFNLRELRKTISESFTAAGMKADQYRIMAGHDPEETLNRLTILFKVPGDESREYVANEFTGLTWHNVTTDVERWLKAE